MIVGTPHTHASIAKNVMDRNFYLTTLETKHTSDITHIIFKNPFTFTVADTELKCWDLSTRTCKWTYSPTQPGVNWEGFVRIIEGRLVCTGLRKDTLKGTIHILSEQGAPMAVITADIALSTVCVVRNRIFAVLNAQHIVEFDLDGCLLNMISSVILGSNMMVANERFLVRIDGDRVLSYDRKYFYEQKAITLKFDKCKSLDDDAKQVYVNCVTLVGETLYCGLRDTSTSGLAPDCIAVDLNQGKLTENEYRVVGERPTDKTKRPCVTKCFIDRDQLFISFDNGPVIAKDTITRMENILQPQEYDKDKHKAADDIAVSGDILAFLIENEIRLVNHKTITNEKMTRSIDLEKKKHSRNIVFEGGRLIYTIAKTIFIRDYRVTHTGVKSANGWFGYGAIAPT